MHGCMRIAWRDARWLDGLDGTGPEAPGGRRVEAEAEEYRD